MNDNKTCQVFHADLWGLRDNKYKCLLENDIKTTEWQKLSPKSEFYLFIPRDEKLLGKYEKNVKITDIFQENSVGIVTARDKLTIQWRKDDVWNTILNFSKMDVELARMTYKLGKDVRDWKIELAQKDLFESNLEKNKIVPILYRPFDIRYTYYTGKSRGFHCMPRPDVMRHMFQDNLGIITSRQMDKSLIQPVLVTNSIIDAHSITSAVSISYIFPLYLYPETDKNDLFTPTDPQEKQPNINPVVFRFLTDSYNKKPTPEDIFYYIYAVLYSNIYRGKYSEFLKIDFPRVPFTEDYRLFNEMGKMGKRLAGLHLMKSPELDTPVAKFPAVDGNKVEKLNYDSEIKRVYINKNQYFEGVPPDVWEYQIGGYQVCRKWLKDRKGRKLSNEDIKHYCRIVMAIKKTIELQNKIDEFYPDVEKNLIEFNDT